MLLDDTVPCWGRAGADICTACTRLQAPADYTGSFPNMRLLVPGAVLERARDGSPQWLCAERRVASTHRPAAVCDAEAVVVGAVADPAHGRRLGGIVDACKHLMRGGAWRGDPGRR